MEQLIKPQKLLNRNFLLLFQGQLVSVMGSSAYSLAFVFWLKQATGSASIMGLLGMAAMLPALILGPLGGTLADHFSRKRILVCCDITNGLIVSSTTLVMFFRPDDIDLIITMLFVGAVVSGASMSVFQPAIMSLVPELVPSHRLMMANGLMQNCYLVVGIVGQAVGGVLFRVLGAPLLMLVNGISYILSGLLESFIEEKPQPPKEERSWRETLQKFKRDTLDGFRYVKSSAGLKALLLFTAARSFFMGPLPVLMPFFVEDTLGVPVDWFGYLIASSAIGVLTGSGLMGLLRIKPQVRSYIVLSGYVVTAIAFVSFGFCSNPLVAAMIQFFIGLVMGASGILITSALQLGTPAYIRGRVFGLMGTLGAALMPISMGLAGVFTDMLNQNVALIFVFMGAGMFLCVPIVAFNKGFHRMLAIS